MIICEDRKKTYRRTNITATLHQDVLYAGLARLNPLLSEDPWTKHFEFTKKKHLKDPQLVRNKILWPDEPEIQAESESDWALLPGMSTHTRNLF